MNHVARDHHYVPQFFLRNFAVDPERRKLTTVGKHGTYAIWATRSIEQLGFERDLYVQMRGGMPVSVETEINHQIETPISRSDTWAKISSGCAHALDRSDKPVLYALIQHLEARTPHYRATARELAQLADTPDSPIPFTPEEREMYAVIRTNPDAAQALFAQMAASLRWTERRYRGAALSIFRSPIALRSSTNPVLVMRTPPHPAIQLPLPGMVPYQLVLTLDRTTLASLTFGDFDDAFLNQVIGIDVARGFNRHFVGQFAHFEHVRHLITDREGLSGDMTWAPYDLLEEKSDKIRFCRRPAA